MAFEFIQQFLARSTANASRSTVLTDLRWLLGILLAGLLGTGRANVPAWVVVLLGVLCGIAATLYVVAYVYFSLTQPDALRSERFTLSKLALEQSSRQGDNVKGFETLDSRTEQPVLPASHHHTERK